MIVRLTFILLVPALLSAQGSSNGASFLRLPFSARNAALAEATVADHSHFLSSLLNPSLIAGSSAFEFSVSHQQWIQDVQSEFFAIRAPLSTFSLAFSAATTGVDDIEVRTVPGPPAGVFTARSAVFSASAATTIAGPWRAGLTVKYFYEKIFTDELSGGAIDLGLTFPTPIDDVSAGASVLNIGFSEKFRNQTVELPTLLRVGAAHTLEREDISLTSLVSLSSHLNSDLTQLHLGMELTYRSAVGLRVGYLTGMESRGLSAGLGVSYGIFLFDYGFVPFTYGLGSAHLATLGIRL